MSLARNRASKGSGRPKGVSGSQKTLSGNTITQGNSTADSRPLNQGPASKTLSPSKPAGFGKFVDVLTPGGQKNP